MGLTVSSAFNGKGHGAQSTGHSGWDVLNLTSKNLKSNYLLFSAQAEGGKNGA
ncbi:hypothetical protein ACT29H_16450 [Thermophagus sp. OGC60D27]|uniref:hypothetical protein n=1 Tax=Thermophagus sp. OGC60D27 TaxID=3458415 RepID=UPI00403764E0